MWIPPSLSGLGGTYLTSVEGLGLELTAVVVDESIHCGVSFRNSSRIVGSSTGCSNDRQTRGPWFFERWMAMAVACLSLPERSRRVVSPSNNNIGCSITSGYFPSHLPLICHEELARGAEKLGHALLGLDRHTLAWDALNPCGDCL
ncbi:hypothetical protein VTN96DRAFT_3247 [Rasamsonia emersonii]